MSRIRRAARLRVDSSRDAAEVLHAVLPPLKKLASDTMSDLVQMKRSARGEPGCSRTLRARVDGCCSGRHTPVLGRIPVTAPSPPMWKAPSPLPAKPGWTWRTVSGDVYNDVKIVGMGQDSVIILYTGGGRRVAVADLPLNCKWNSATRPPPGQRWHRRRMRKDSRPRRPDRKMMPGWVTED